MQNKPTKQLGFKRLLGNALLETIWPSRCALCDTQGALLCEDCQVHLPYIDITKACPVCGAPYGIIQCTGCSKALLAPLGLTVPPFDACVTAVELTPHTGRIVTLCKDVGEQMLGTVMGEIVARFIPPDWMSFSPLVTSIPTSERSFEKRGFDHGEIIAQAVADQLSLLFTPLFERPETSDQRDLGRVERFRNMSDSLRLIDNEKVPKAAIVIDDVYTTGATLFAAAIALKQAGVEKVFCATFART